MARRRWSRRFPRGSVVDHPAVAALLERGDPGTRVRVAHVHGTTLVTYSTTRVYMKRDAWEALPADGVFVQVVRPKGETAWAIAMTPAELHDVFGEVRNTRSWEDARCYHFPQVPPAAGAFRVEVPWDGQGAESVRRPPPTRRRPTPKTSPRPEVTKTPQEVAATVLSHLETHGPLTEAQVVIMAGNARAYRRVRRLLEGTPGLTIIRTDQGARWALEAS